MKSLRRSLGDKKDSHSSSHSTSPSASSPTFGQTPQLSKPSASIAPPKKVIKAKENHTSTSPQELPFVKGEFFFVVGEKADPRGGPGYYEALNTITNARGLVPKAKFEEFGRGGTKEGGGRSPTTSVIPATSSNPAGSQRSSAAALAKPSLLYAVVQYDFIAERPDELEAYAGENIVITAQSNHEWLVAKPVARLGGPGLIPVSFVEIRDPHTQLPVTDVQAVLNAGGIPKVEEWKEQTAKYKKESIPLGRFEFNNPGGVANSPYGRPSSGAVGSNHQQQQSITSQHSRGPSQSHSHSQSQSYASSQPRQSQPISQNDRRSTHKTNPSTSSSIASSAEPPAYLPPGTFSSASVVSFHSEGNEFLFRIHANFLPDNSSEPSLRLIIFRLYDDFYHFQIELLDTFRIEAGRAVKPDEAPEPDSRILPFMPGPLDFIDNAICSQRTKDLDVYVRQLVALHRRQAGYILEHDLVRGFFAPKAGDIQNEIPREDVETELRKEQSLPPMEDDDDDPDATLGGGGRLENAVASMGISDDDPRRSHASRASHASYSSNASGSPRDSSPHTGRPPSASTHHTNDSSRPSSTNYDDNTHRPSTATTTSSWGNNSRTSAGAGPLSASLSSSQQSGGGASAAFKKIKIFDRATDDLIAIRVPTNVTYEQLRDKVQDRLGGAVRTLKYRDSMAGPNSGGMQLIEDDDSLEDWLRKEDKLDKLMLYAD